MYKNCFRKMFLASMLAVLLLGLIPISIQADGETAGMWGPRVDHLQLIIYPDYDHEVQAFKQGLIDVMDWPLAYEDWQDLQGNPDFVLEPLTMWDSYPLDLNCLNWPTSDYLFRKAIAYLVPYEDFYTNVLHAFAGELMDSMVWSEPEWSEWYNPDAPKYWYNPSIAIQILESAGYKNWDPSDDWLEWKAPNGTIFDLPPLEYYAREDDPLRAALGTMHAAELEAVGIEVNLYVVDKEICWAHAYCMPYDYHIYTEGLGPYNNLFFFYDYWHSQFADPTIDWAWNNVFFINDTYDDWITQYKYAADLETSKYAFKQALAVMMDQVPLIPVYHSAGASAYRAKYGHWSGEEAYWDMSWNGFPNVKFALVTAGVSDWWTFLNAHPDDVSKGGVLRFGLLSELDHINPVTQYSTWDMFLASALYGTLLLRNPFTGEYLPYFARDWTIGTWDNEGETATKITFHLFENLKWSDGLPLTSEDVAFTMKYMYDAAGSTFYPSVEMIDDIETDTPHIETPDPYTITIYFSVESIWFLEMVGFVPIIPKHVWENIPPEQVEEQGEYVTTGNLTCSGPYVIAGHEPSQWWLLRANPYFFRYNPNAAAISNVKPLKNVVCQGYTMRISTAILNVGYSTETFQVKIYANETQIATTTINIETCTLKTLTITWNTSDYPKGNYTIRAYVEPIPGEDDTTDNDLVDGLVSVSIVADVNADGKVDLKDVFAVALAYGSFPGHPKWNSNLDINDDEKIDLKDYWTAALNYGKVDP